ncbi:translation initiation factor IF-2-like [Hyaena hyaena]|uniref:translation initiation factor IF-2-like n=1 Tax=Hyaena hyaena TaxID=95912 RepID=UPI00192162EA|nr:translation initiation factor IF-2-like [Hyaena hyaena]
MGQLMSGITLTGSFLGGLPSNLGHVFSTRINSLLVSRWRAQTAPAPEVQRGPASSRRSASAARARTRGPTRGHCSLRAIVPASPGHGPPCGGRGTRSAERQGPSRTAPGLPRANLRSPRETATAIRIRAPRSRAARMLRVGFRADLPSPRHAARKGRPFPAAGPPVRSRALRRHPVPAQLHLGCSRPGRHPSRSEENFPGSRRGLRAQGTPPPARRRFPSLGARFPDRRRAREPSDSPLLWKSRKSGTPPPQQDVLAGPASTWPHTTPRDEFRGPRTGAASRHELTCTRRSSWTAGGAAAPPPSEEPEPQDARGRAAALSAQFRRRFPGGSRALTPGLLRPSCLQPAPGGSSSRPWTSPGTGPLALATARTIH